MTNTKNKKQKAFSGGLNTIEKNLTPEEREAYKKESAKICKEAFEKSSLGILQNHLNYERLVNELCQPSLAFGKTSALTGTQGLAEMAGLTEIGYSALRHTQHDPNQLAESMFGGLTAMQGLGGFFTKPDFTDIALANPPSQFRDIEESLALATTGLTAIGYSALKYAQQVGNDPNQLAESMFEGLTAMQGLGGFFTKPDFTDIVLANPPSQFRNIEESLALATTGLTGTQGLDAAAGLTAIGYSALRHAQQVGNDPNQLAESILGGLTAVQDLDEFSAVSALTVDALKNIKSCESFTKQENNFRNIPDLSYILPQPSNKELQEKIEVMNEQISGLQEVILKLIKQLNGDEEPSKPDEPTEH